MSANATTRATDFKAPQGAFVPGKRVGGAKLIMISSAMALTLSGCQTTDKEGLCVGMAVGFLLLGFGDLGATVGGGEIAALTAAEFLAIIRS